MFLKPDEMRLIMETQITELSELTLMARFSQNHYVIMSGRLDAIH